MSASNPTICSFVERHDGLVVDEELSQIESFAQIGFKLQAFDSAGMHGIVEDLAASFPIVSWPVHGDLCVAEHILGLGARAAAECDPDARGENDFVTIYNRRGGQASPECARPHGWRRWDRAVPA